MVYSITWIIFDREKHNTSQNIHTTSHQNDQNDRKHPGHNKHGDIYEASSCAAIVVILYPMEPESIKREVRLTAFSSNDHFTLQQVLNGLL